MSRFGRRTFLASSAGVAAGAAAAGALPGVAGPAGAADAERALGGTGVLAAPPPGPLRAGALTVNGATDPVGVDPDDCSFAWTLRASGAR